MSSAPVRRLTREEYLEIERRSGVRHQFHDGEMKAMKSGNRVHNLIAGNLGGELGIQLRDRPCEVYTAAMRVLVDATGLTLFPKWS